ncbi:MAG: phosphotransferase, partial [Spirochaetales bacterium]|nr:phosphotransferase [Spirochaetales bacterium]
FHYFIFGLLFLCIQCVPWFLKPVMAFAPFGPIMLHKIEKNTTMQMSMKYSTLTNRGKLRRLRSLALKALSEYNLKVTGLTFHCFNTNLLYRVYTSTGDRYILRLASPGWRTLTDLKAEAMWLEALSRDTGIHVPGIIKTRDGESVLPAQIRNVPDIWNTILMSWQPGRLLGKYINTVNLRKMGELFAKLHIHGKNWTPPPGFSTRKFEHFLSRGEPNVIFLDKQRDVCTPGQIDLLKRMYDRVESAYSGMDRSDLRVIHCDLWHDNIKLYKGELYPFDFEDTVWGFRLHDIAMAMLDLLEDFGNDRYPALSKAFRQGYETYLEWPRGEIEIFQIGRLLWKINFVARFRQNWFSHIVKQYIPVFTHYEQTGSLQV